jgi:hypothetical protein
MEASSVRLGKPGEAAEKKKSVYAHDGNRTWSLWLSICCESDRRCGEGPIGRLSDRFLSIPQWMRQ